MAFLSHPGAIGKSIILAVLPVCFALASSAHAATILDLPVVAGHVIDNDADGFDSTDPASLLIAFSDNNIVRSIRRGVIEFDLSLLPAGAPTDSIVLSAFQFSIGTDGGGPLQVRGYAGNGTLDLTDVTQTSPVLGTYNDLLNTTMTIDVSAFIRDLLAQGERYAGFELRATEEASHLDSSGFGLINSASRQFVSPELTFAVPEPSHLVLFGLCCIVFVRGRRSPHPSSS